MSVALKSDHPINPANTNMNIELRSGFVIPATVPKTNAKMPAANNGCRITQATPNAV
jgi:hypothetical protein